MFCLFIFKLIKLKPENMLYMVSVFQKPIDNCFRAYNMVYIGGNSMCTLKCILHLLVEWSINANFVKEIDFLYFVQLCCQLLRGVVKKAKH